jgi:CelD/BcsL family acetyltransferase involved in cellulose biosynthesis
MAQSAILFSVVRDFRGERIVCLPFSDYCDPLVNDEKAWKDLIRPLKTYNLPIRLRCLRSDIPLRDEQFVVCKAAKWHGIDLARSEREIWESLRGNARQNIRHARRSGVTVRIGKTADDAVIFHRMHARLRKTKYRLLAQPWSFFENLYQVFVENNDSVVLLAELDDSPIAGIFLLYLQDAAYYKFNATLDQRHRPNDLLMWHALLLARQHGLRRIDLGLSDSAQLGLLRFKRKFATEERDISFLEWNPNTQRHSCDQCCLDLLDNMTHLFTHPSVPDEITWEANEKLYRFFA